MKILKNVLIGLIVLVAVLVVIGFLLPSSAHVERSAVIEAPPVRAKFAELIETLAAAGQGSSTRVMRALLMAEPPSMDKGEMTDKGSINQRAVLASRAALAELRRAVPQIHVSAALLDYGQSLISASRSSPELLHGLSPRAGLALLRAARAWALIQGRQAVIPEDLQTIFPATVGHRLSGVDEGEPLGGDELARRLIQSVPIP